MRATMQESNREVGIISADNYYFFYIIILFRQTIYIILFATFSLFNIILAHANEEAKNARGEK